MKHLLQNCSRTAIVRALGRTAAAVLSVAVLCQPNLASAAPRGGGGGGGFHGGGGFPWRRIRVPRGWISRPRLSRGGFHNGWHSFAGAHTGVVGPDHWYHGWRNGRYGWWWGNGLGWTYYSYPWWGSDPDYGYYDYSQPYASQTWY